MALQKTSLYLGHVVDCLSHGLNWIAGFFLTAMMVLTGVDVAMRYFLNQPIAGSYEIIEYIMPIVVAFGLASCARENGHVQVDLFTSLLPQRIQIVLKAVADFFMAAVYGVITWQSLVRGRELMISGQYSEVLYIPIFPFVFVVSAGCAVLSLVALKQLASHLSEAIKP